MGDKLCPTLKTVLRARNVQLVSRYQKEAVYLHVLPAHPRDLYQTSLRQVAMLARRATMPMILVFPLARCVLQGASQMHAALAPVHCARQAHSRIYTGCTYVYIYIYILRTLTRRRRTRCFLRSGCYGDMQGSLHSLRLCVWAGWCLAGFWLLQGPFLFVRGYI